MTSIEPQKQQLIFDLSEVVISGLAGAEQAIGKRYDREPAEVLRALTGPEFDELLHGHISEEQYLSSALADLGLADALDEVKLLIRRNFHQEVPGMVQFVGELADSYRLVLISDHAREWIEYIEANHSFLHDFFRRFYSFQLGSTKASPETFQKVLGEIDRNPAECILVDDNTGNVAVAASVGMRGVVFVGEAELRSELRKLRIIAE